MPYYAADSDSLFYEERGAGDLVVVLGGGPARHPDYLEDLAGLTERYTLVVPHLRGVGRTPLPSDPANGSWWNQARDLEALRLHLSRERLTVLGHSAGSRIALAYAARFPEALERLVLITPPAADLVDVPNDIDAIRTRRTSDPVHAAAMKAARQGPPADSDDDALTAWQRTIAPLSYAIWERPQQEHAGVGGWSAAAGRAYGTVAPPKSFLSDLMQVQAPVRIIAATEDGITGVAAPVAFASRFRDGRAATLQHAGHYPWVDQPQDFLVTVESALKE